MKNSKNNNIFWGFSFMYLVSVDATDRSNEKLNMKKNYIENKCHRKL